MAQLFDVRLLTVCGVRVTTLPPVVIGYFRLTRDGHKNRLTLVSREGAQLMGPILDPALVLVDPDGFVLAGTEPACGCMQEWQVVAVRRGPGYPAYPVF